MKGSINRSVSLVSAVAFSLFSTASATLDPIVISGSKFFYKTNGTQFFIKGVAYQQGVGKSGTGSLSTNSDYTDPLADADSCKRDVPYLQKLGANLIRTYAIDPTQDHDTCMQLLDAAGIYVISDLGEPNLSINRQTPQWNLELYNRYTAVIDSLAKYTNTVGFFAGNEVTNNISYTPASAYVKAALRDSKAYIKQKGYRPMGVGYAADDDATVRAAVASYFNCGDPNEGIDFWGYNIYSWCDPSDYHTSGYSDRVAEFQDYNVPVFFAEYGCNTGAANGAAGRDFSEVPVLYGSDMSPVFSGGIVYEYFEETNDFGLASVDGSSVSTLKDFGAFSSQIHAVSPTLVNSASYTPTNTAGQSCPTVDSNWQVADNALPPTPNQAVCDCMTASLSCVAKPNLTGDALGDLFGQVCGYKGNPCQNVVGDTSTGQYGAYLGCSPQDQLSNAFDTYYKSQGSIAGACDFGGNATVVKPSGAASSCSSVIASATSAAGSVAVTLASGSGGAAATSTKKPNAGNTVQSSMWIGYWGWVVYLSTVMLSGAGIWLL